MRKILPLALTLCLVFILTTPVFAVLDAPMPNEVFESQEVYFYGRISNLASDCSSVTFEYCYQGGESNLYYNVYLYKSNYKQPWKETPLQKRSGRISSAAGYYTGSYTFDLQGYETGEYYICTFLGDAQGNLLEGTTKNKCYFQIYPENEESPVQAIFSTEFIPLNYRIECWNPTRYAPELPGFIISKYGRTIALVTFPPPLLSPTLL